MPPMSSPPKISLIGDTAPKSSGGMPPLYRDPTAPVTPVAQVAPAAAAALAAAKAMPKLSEDQLKTMGDASKRIAAAFGEIVSLYMRTPALGALPISELEWLVAPAVATGQYTLAEAQSKANGLIQPMGVVMWARVSDEIDRRLASQPDQPIRIKANEWTSGENIWVVDALGEARVVEALLKRMTESVWAGKTVKMRAKGKDGRMAVGELSVGPNPAVSQAG
jgi:cytolysin-activating lysine-acyltransferase